MSSWRRIAIEQFPELATVIAADDRLGLVHHLCLFLEQAIEHADREAVRRVVAYGLWMWRQKRTDEQFVYCVQDLLAPTLRHPSKQLSFARLLAPDQFASLHEVILFVLDEKAAKAYEQEVRVRGA